MKKSFKKRGKLVGHLGWMSRHPRRWMKKNLRKIARHCLADVRQNKDDAVAYRKMLGQGAIFQCNLIFPGNLTQGQYKILERGYEDEFQWKKVIQTLLPYTMVTYDGLMSLAEITRHVLKENIPGDLVEAGTWRGGAAGMMALAALSVSGPVRKMHLFDSFQGIPEPDRKHDPVDWIVNDMKLPEAEAMGRLRGIKALEAPRKDLEKVLFEICSYPREKVAIYEGWFQETVPSAAQNIDAISVLRLDGDLYASTKVCLEHLYPKLVPGGFLIIDDWCLAGARQAVMEYLEKQEHRPFRCLADGTVRYFIRP
jgi:O-methyltransferase